MNKVIMIFIVGIFIIGTVSAISADYYFHPQCGHCQQVKPLIQQVSNHFRINWVDTSEPKSYPISGTPTVIIHATGGRQVILTGSYEIPKYLLCELNEQSTKECVTYTYLNCTTNSFFVRE